MLQKAQTTSGNALASTASSVHLSVAAHGHEEVVPSNAVESSASSGLPSTGNQGCQLYPARSLSAAFLDHLDAPANSPAEGVATCAASEGQVSSPEKQTSHASWELINEGSASSGLPVPQVCTVKRYRKQVLPIQDTPAMAPACNLLQAFPKAASRRSRSPPRAVSFASADRSSACARVDHRHRLGLGSKLQLLPASPLPAPTPAPRSGLRVAAPSASLDSAPPLPRPKDRAPFYARHNRTPVPAAVSAPAPAVPATRALLAGLAGRSPASAHDSGSTFVQTHRGWTRDGARSGLTLQQGLHQQQFDNVLLIWELVRPLVAPFSLVLQDLERSSNSSELELGLLRTVAETTACRYLQVVHKFLEQLRELWCLTWDVAKQSAVVDCILSLRRDHQDCHQLNCVKALRWIAKLLRLQVDDLYDGLFRPLVNVAGSDKLHRESYPLPWRLVSFLEHALIFALGPGNFCSWPVPA